MKSLFDANFFEGNRRSLISRLGYGSLAIVTANGLMQRNGDLAYRFEQEPNFWYLSGISQPEWWLIISGIEKKTWLVRPDCDEQHEFFEGNVTDADALRISGATKVVDRIEAKRLLTMLKAKHRIVYTIRPQSIYAKYGFHPNPALKEFSRQLSGFDIRDMRRDVQHLRALKQPQEIAAMTKAAEITADGLRAVIDKRKSLRYEYNAEALLNFEFNNQGAAAHAFDPIVSSGKNTCTLHYMQNNRRLDDDDWLLMDVGARFDNYCADVTRTFPTGTVSDRHKQIHAAVVDVCQELIALCVSGASVAGLQSEADDLVFDRLVELNIVAADAGDEALRRHFPHAYGHGIGLEPHESLGDHRQLVDGMTLAIEPGIYIPEENFGVRIEETILISGDKPKILSGSLPRTNP